MKAYKVTAAYVTLRVNNDLGQDVVLGFHQGAVLPDGVQQEDLERHVRKGMVAEEGSREADLLAVPAGTPVPGEPPNVPVSEASGLNLGTADRARRAQDASEDGRRARRQRSGDEAKG
ncbi:hypothetical protein O7598_30850 [Micromonospora sp. WMMC241]|uniref:hypothetical protein n=1 Tax=Micromonospora sp. WMMC241 TaxID=3015159 RepID=UPI0022B74C0E|nr:hypothetical protein [Micromonospora sp. WMMC241]MCZ7440823.1 hypothetical protein [Micromonospora sp. WMMC241]